jgi:uncharacterized protein YprB with RNaseH-like and TPR domain
VSFGPLSPRAYLDIETDWLRNITVVGVFRPDRGCRQWVRPDLAAEPIADFLRGIEVLFTYNGARFDLPIIKDQLRLDLKALHPHRDLMHDCWSRRLFGGLKGVERTLGIHRDTEGVDGLEAIRLWGRFLREGEKEALEVLLRYNREDVENLEALAVRLGIVGSPH